MPPIIASPLRMLLLSAPETSPLFLKGKHIIPAHSDLLELLSNYTDATYPPSDISHHEIQTPYYNAAIPIWRDELPTSAVEIEMWKKEWLGQEAGEVVQAIGAWVVCFRKPREEADLSTIRILLAAIQEVVSKHTSSGYIFSGPLLLAVGMRQAVSPSVEVTNEQWEELCMDCGPWEWIDGELGRNLESNKESSKERNEFGETLGIERLKEALEACEWEGIDVDTKSDDLGLEDGFGAEAAELKREMTSLQIAVKGAKRDDGADEEVEELENMMLRIQAIKDMGADMPESERRKFAAKAVSDVVRSH